MVAEFALIQFKTIAGSTAVGSGALPPDSSGQKAFAFFGSEGNVGYVSSTSIENALAYPVTAGRSSWEVWLAARFNGFAFGQITGVTWFIDSIDPTGLGTLPDGTVVRYEVPRGTSVMDRTGVVGRVQPGAIEKSVSPLDPGNFVPASAPRYGLPVSEDAIPLMEPGILNGLDLTPLQASDSGNDPGEEFGQRKILESNLEPRYSNLAVLTMILASDATPVAQDLNPFLFGVSWMES